RMIGAQEVRQHPRVERVTLGTALPKPVPSAIERLGIDRIDDAMVEQPIDHRAVGPLEAQRAMPCARHSSSSRPHSLTPPAVCDTARAVTFIPLSSTTQTACV